MPDEMELADLTESTEATGTRTVRELEAVYDIPVTVSAVLGKTTMQVSQLLKLGRGAVVELDCSPDDPVEIIVNDRVIAHGEVVVVSGNYGVRVTKIASRQDDQETDRAASDLFSLSQKLR